ncbi:MAG TPA: hypothetical protein VL197_15000 [Nitrospirota bacterium]|nr:hypothetical protein [Nitrospirota bacterium]
MKKSVTALGTVVFILALGLSLPATVGAGVSVNVTIPLPPLVLPAPPPLVVIPGSYVYYPPEVGVDIFFYHGNWYRPYRGGWYIAHDYNGPWRTVGPGRVPRVILGVPHDYRRIPPRYARMPYGEVQHNWRTWERDRRWDHEQHARVERGEHQGRDHERGEDHGYERHGRE